MLRRRGGATSGVETRLRKRLRPADRGSPEAAPATEDPAVDPRLMTERQQLAFLLRATAQDASSSSGSDEEESGDGDGDGDGDRSEASGEGEARPRALRRLRRAADAPAVTYRSRGRPSKIPDVPDRHGDDKENARDGPDADEPWLADGSLPSAADERGPIASSPERPEAKIPAAELVPDAKISADAAAACALCCRGERLVVDATAPLFLCARCDRKYPTQQALGRPCAA